MDELLTFKFEAFEELDASVAEGDVAAAFAPRGVFVPFTVGFKAACPEERVVDAGVGGGVGDHGPRDGFDAGQLVFIVFEDELWDADAIKAAVALNVPGVAVIEFSIARENFGKLCRGGGTAILGVAIGVDAFLAARALGERDVGGDDVFEFAGGVASRGHGLHLRDDGDECAGEEGHDGDGDEEFDQGETPAVLAVTIVKCFHDFERVKFRLWLGLIDAPRNAVYRWMLLQILGGL